MGHPRILTFNTDAQNYLTNCDYAQLISALLCKFKCSLSQVLQAIAAKDTEWKIDIDIRHCS
jgi:hypothetical protein